MADIDLGQYTGAQFHIIGNVDTPFTGAFDGDRKKIAHFRYAGEDQNNIGLFGCASTYGTKISDMCIVEPNVSVVQNGHNIRLHRGLSLNGGVQVTNCVVMNGTVEGNENVGGVIGTGRQHDQAE